MIDGWESVRKESVEVIQSSNQGAYSCKTSSALFIQADLKAGKCFWLERSPKLSAYLDAIVTRPQISGGKWMDGWFSN